MKIDPEEWSLRARAQDPHVGRLLFVRYQAFVNGRVLRVLGRDCDHDDIVQDVFEALFGGLSGVKDPARLDAWVAAVTYHTILKELRRRKWRWPWSRREPDVPDLADESPSSCEALEARQLVVRMYAALHRLPSRQHLAYSLSVMADRPLAEIAEECQCSLATVKRDIEKARVRLRRLAELDPVLGEYLRRCKEEG